MPSHEYSMISGRDPRRVAVLGSSGSIGSSALDVIEASGGILSADILVVGSNTKKLVEQARRFRPRTVVVSDIQANREVLAELPPGTEVLFGQDQVDEVVRRPEIDVVLSAIVGCAGLRSTWSALDAGKTVALANKESLVVGGLQLMKLSVERGGRILPVDSEHSAIYQCLLSRRLSREASSTRSLSEELSKLILTGSGGPFRTWTREQIHMATVAEALNHPTWQMGRKITIDSATLMNKALEIIEATWLFGVPSDRIAVVLHPQSIVHSMVEFVDGTVMAQLAWPDMKLPIQLALNDAFRFSGPSRRLDWSKACTLDFIPPDPERFPALQLGHDVAACGGSAGAVVNAANETAVDAFLEGRLPLDRIVPACRAIFEQHHYEAAPTLEQLFELDRWARKETHTWISS